MKQLYRVSRELKAVGIRSGKAFHSQNGRAAVAVPLFAKDWAMLTMTWHGASGRSWKVYGVGSTVQRESTEKGVGEGSGDISLGNSENCPRMIGRGSQSGGRQAW